MQNEFAFLNILYLVLYPSMYIILNDIKRFYAPFTLFLQKDERNKTNKSESSTTSMKRKCLRIIRLHNT